MRVFRTSYTARDGRAKQAAKWYVEVRDHLSAVRRFPAFTDKGQSETLGRQIERLIRYRACGDQPDVQLSRWLEQIPGPLLNKLVSIGILDPRRAAASKTLARHIDDFRQCLLDKGDTEKQATQVTSRVTRIVEGCGFQTWSDVQASRVQRFLAELRNGEGGISRQTANFYLQAIRQFCAWMVSDRRAGESPVAHLRGFKAGEIQDDRRHPRRALEVDEARRLLEATRNAPIRFRMTGDERAVLYRLAIETGLRSLELRSLTVASFDLVGCTVTVTGRHAKNKKTYTLPLRPDTAGELRRHFAAKTPEASAFRMPSKSRIANMIQADLAATQEVDAQGKVTLKAIPYVDDAGRYADFHALRHTTGSFLAAAGVHPKVAMEIMRHSRIDLTMNIYTHTLKGQNSEAIARLPDLSAPSAQRERARATGTDGGDVTRDADLALRLALQGGKQRTSMDDPGRQGGNGPSGGTLVKPEFCSNNGISNSEMQEAAPGFEPGNNDFANRRLSRLATPPEPVRYR